MHHNRIFAIDESYKALVDSFSAEVQLPVHVNQVLAWIRENTDHKNIALHGVDRGSKSFRGAFRRRAINTGGVYSQEYDIYTDIFYGLDLEDDWKRLVIVKEVIHVFDANGSCVDTPEKLARLIPSIITNQLSGSPFEPALNDHFGPFRAMAVLLPAPLRQRMKESIDNGSRTIEEVAAFCHLPLPYVDIWINYAHQIEPLLFEIP
ncbi:hypothetical protein GGE07_001525 [Sinorhizobium terangae]|uniref:Uncharacterized protein n=1 Tax=Sinorhizobium terangae TaxID=110322 RepID=A0A6N7LMF8_SINTE|nr:hypothetical protein [Sinorhizobium terangae]MBB4184896.1 hypothetical protein [Sinorhizobium terangae]MQX18418.1 hypothetical protein [Sinorhizobium terangae]